MRRRAGHEDAFVPVVPSDGVTEHTVAVVDLKNLTFAREVAGMDTIHHDLVADLRVHSASLDRAHC